MCGSSSFHREAEAEALKFRKEETMRRYAILTLSVCLLALSGIYTHAGAGLDEWTSNGPYGGNVQSMVLDPSDWIETAFEGLLSGSRSGIAAKDLPGNLVSQGVQGMIFSSQEDFRSGAISWNVSVREEGGVVLNALPSYNKYLLPHWGTSVRDVYIDESTGNIYYTRLYGLMVIGPDGRSISYRNSGVWDTTEDIIGTLITSTVRITNNWVGDMAMDVERGDVYLPTDNGGLNVIHTRKTFDPTDDRVDVYDEYSHPAILMHDPVSVWRDEEGNIYLGFHLNAGITILHPDSTSTSYTAERGVLNTTETGSLWAAPVISRIPRIGATFEAKPFFRDRDGNLYVGTDRGLTVLHYNSELGRYDTSVIYRSTGVWDTTEDLWGTLLRSEPRIVTRNGFSMLHTDGTVTIFSVEREDYTSSAPVTVQVGEDL